MDLVGRSAELAALSALVAENRVVFVYGPAGIGKTALVRAALADASPPFAYVSLADVRDARTAIARTARAFDVPPPPVENDADRDEALAALLAAKPHTLVWDDIADTRLAKLVAHAAAGDPRARIVLVSRRFFTAEEAGLRAAAFEVKPLSPAETVALVRALEVERGRTLADDVADAAGGNPLLVQLALRGERASVQDGDAESVLRREIEAAAQGTARAVLAALVAANAPLDARELTHALGGDAARAVDVLRKRLVVTRIDGKTPLLALAPSVARIAREVVGQAAGRPATWKIVRRVADRMLGSKPHDDAAMSVAARARVELGDAADALHVIRTHHLARASADPSVIDGLLRAIAAAKAELRAPALLVLAREELRIGDYAAARRALDDLPRAKTYEDAERAALLRAECHIRAGEPAAAQRAIDDVASLAKKKSAQASPAFVLTRAQLAILRGELADARKTLEALARATKGVPPLEARRAVQIAGSYLYEERYDETHRWIERARAATKAAGMRVEPVATILDVHALLGLGEISRAEEIIAREASGRPHAPMLEIALHVRRGEHTRALAEATAPDGALASVDRRSDLLFRSVVARDLARAAMAIGSFARAAKMLRLAEAGADEPGLAALRPICDAEEARLAEARGDGARAKRAIDRAFAVIPRSPFVAVDHAAMHGKTPAAHDDDPPVAFAYAALRAAELHVAEGRLDAAIAAAERAERFHADAGMHYEAARASLVLAEASARRVVTPKRRRGKTNGSTDDGERALVTCESLAREHGYPLIAVAALLVRSFAADARGDVSAAAWALEDAVAAATLANVVDAALVRAARRVGVIAAAPTPSSPRPFEAIVERLGLARPAEVLWRVGDRTFLRAKTDAAPAAIACTVDLDERTVELPTGAALALPEQRIQLLVALAESGAGGATLEELFALVWRGAFHPLRHRNAVYVALTRLKDSLRPFTRDVRLAHDGERYRLVGPSPVAVRRRVTPSEIAALVKDGFGPQVHDD